MTPYEAIEKQSLVDTAGRTHGHLSNQCQVVAPIPVVCTTQWFIFSLRLQPVFDISWQPISHVQITGATFLWYTTIPRKPPTWLRGLHHRPPACPLVERPSNHLLQYPHNSPSPCVCVCVWVIIKIQKKRKWKLGLISWSTQWDNIIFASPSSNVPKDITENDCATHWAHLPHKSECLGEIENIITSDYFITFCILTLCIQHNQKQVFWRKNTLYKYNITVNFRVACP